MSVEYCVVRVTPTLFEQIQQEPDILHDRMDEFYAGSAEHGQGKEYVASRDVFRGLPVYDRWQRRYQIAVRGLSRQVHV